MLPYTTRGRGLDVRDTELGRTCTYDLMCVVVHVGELDTGELSIKQVWETAC